MFTRLVRLLALFLVPSQAAQVQNWYGDVVVDVNQDVAIQSVDDIVNVLLNTEQYPSPVRAAGSRHSMVPVEFAAGGTVLDMRPLNAILDISTTHVTAQAGALYIDVAEELDKVGLQFHVNFEFGSISFGAAAVGSTKESSLPGQFGKLSSYVTAVKMVKPDGTLVEINEQDDPELMRQVRSSYGLLGVVYEVTFQVRPRRGHDVEHNVYSVGRFTRMLSDLVGRNDSSIFGYLDPFAERIVVETKRYSAESSDNFDTRVWSTRNTIWSDTTPRTCSMILRWRWLPLFLRYLIIDTFQAFLRLSAGLLTASNTKAMDQMLRYDDNPGDRKFRFTFQAYPLESAATVIPAYNQFCKDYRRQTGYRTDLPAAVYIIPTADTKAILSYSYDGPIFTIDSVTTGEADGWFEFLNAYNEFAVQKGGIPTLGQTPMLTRSQVERAFGMERLNTFEEVRKQYDPSGRLLSDYFRNLLPT